jgi:RNA polymerase sigma factor (sigma-70 family)
VAEAEVGARVEDVVREVAPQVLGALVRRYGNFDACEDAEQEALLAAAVQWPADGMPDNPRGWLITVASRRLADQWRSDEARRRREVTATTMTPPDELLAPSPEDLADASASGDDTLTLLFLCCHPALSPASQVALTLRAVGGLTTGEIARAFLVPESTLGQRISRAKRKIRTSRLPFSMPPEDERQERLRVVLQVLYLIFNEGYTTSSGPDLQRNDLTAEAIRLTRAVHRLLPEDGEVAGLLALMILTDARRAARTRDGGDLVPLAEQDRSTWDTALIAEGVDVLQAALARDRLGEFQAQAAIAALHADARTAEETDWVQIVEWYDELARLTDSPIVRLNRAVALGEADGPRAGLAALAALDDSVPRHAAVAAYFHERDGDLATAARLYAEAAYRATNAAERDHLTRQAARLNARRGR